jgi:hypothetical protein
MNLNGVSAWESFKRFIKQEKRERERERYNKFGDFEPKVCIIVISDALTVAAKSFYLPAICLSDPRVSQRRVGKWGM